MPKFGVQWFLNRTNRLTKFRQNRKRSGFFGVDLTRNDPRDRSMLMGVGAWGAGLGSTGVGEHGGGVGLEGAMGVGSGLGWEHGGVVGCFMLGQKCTEQNGQKCTEQNEQNLLFSGAFGCPLDEEEGGG